MNERIPVCRKCKKECKEQLYGEPTWFGKYAGGNLVEVICIDCWNNGEKWAKEGE